MVKSRSSDGPLGRLLASEEMTRLNVLSLLAQAGYALKRGRKRRAALLLGTATLASRHEGLSYAVQATLTANDLRRKLYRS